MHKATHKVRYFSKKPIRFCMVYSFINNCYAKNAAAGFPEYIISENGIIRFRNMVVSMV
jgi:hypothetical protein